MTLSSDSTNSSKGDNTKKINIDDLANIISNDLVNLLKSKYSDIEVIETAAGSCTGDRFGCGTYTCRPSFS